MKKFLFISNDKDKHYFEQIEPSNVDHLHLIGKRFDAIIMDEESMQNLTDEQWLEIKCSRNYGGIIIALDGVEGIIQKR